MPWIPPLLQEDEYARRRSSSAARPASRPGATSPTVGGAKRPRPTPASDLRVAMKEARLQRLLQVRGAGKELAASIRKDYKEKKEAGRDRVLSEARESWEEKLQEQLATLTARLQHTARVIGAGHRQASTQKGRAEAQQEAKAWRDRQHRQQEHRRSATAAQARRQQLAEVQRPEVEAAEKEQVRRELGRKTRQQAHIKAQERAAKLEAAEEEAQALADLRADPRTFLAVHTGQDVIERGEGGFDLHKLQYSAHVVRHGVPIGLPEAEATLPAFVGVRNEAEQARRQAAAARQEKDEELQRMADRQKEREERAAKVQQSLKMVQSMEDDLGALAALDRRRKQHKSNVLARNVLAHQMANAKHRTTRLRAEEDLEATLLACAPFVAPTAPQASQPAPRRVSVMGGVENEDPASAPLPPPTSSLMVRLPPPPPPPPEDEFTWELGGAAAAGAPRRGAEELQRQREEEEEEEDRDAEATQRMWSELERLKDKVTSMEGRQHEAKEESARSRRAMAYRPLEGFADDEEDEDEEQQPPPHEDEDQHAAAPPAPSPPTRTDWGVSKEVVSQVLKGLVGEATVEREARMAAQATLAVVREEREGADEEDEERHHARGAGARLAHSAASEEVVEEEDGGDVAIADELLARAEQDLVNAGGTVPTQGEGGGSRGGLAGLRARGVPFDPKLEELEQQRRKLAEVRALTRSLEASSATESGSGGSQQTPAPVPSSSLRPVPKPASLPASRAPNESTAPLTLPTAHTGRGVNEGTIEDLRTQLGGAALQQPRPADRQDRGPSPTSPGAQRRGMSPLPEGAGRRHAGDAGGERELGAGLGVEGSRTRASGGPSRRVDEGQGGRGRDEGRPGRGEEEGTSRKGYTGEKEGRRDEGRPGSDGRDGASAGLGPLMAEEPPRTPQLFNPLLARLRDTEASMTPSSDVMSDLTVAGDSTEGQQPLPTFTEARLATLPLGGGGMELGRGVRDDEGCSTPSSLSHPQGIHLLDQGLSDDEDAVGLECYSLDTASSSSPPPASLTRPPIPPPPSYAAAAAMRHPEPPQSRGGEVVLVSSAEHGVEISLSDHTLSSGEARQRATFLSSAAPASAPPPSYPEEDEEEDAAPSLPSPSAPSPPPPRHPPRDTDPRGYGGGAADYFSEQDLPIFGEGPTPTDFGEPRHGQLPHVPAPSAPPPPEDHDASASLRSSTSDLIYTLQHLDGEEIDVLGASGGAEYGGAASAYPPYPQPDYEEEPSDYAQPPQYQEGVEGYVEMAPQWQEGEEVAGWARDDEEEDEAGMGGGRRPASVFDIPLTDQAGHDQQPKSLQEQFLERRRRLAQRFEQRRKSREDTKPERPAEARADVEPRGPTTRRTSRGASVDRRASGGGGGGMDDTPAVPQRLVEGRRSPVDMREARERTARAYANLPEVRRRREEEERARARLEVAKKAADMKKFKPQR